MAFTSGNRRIDKPAVLFGYEADEEKKRQDWERSMDQARQTAQVSAQFAQNVQAENARQDRIKSQQRDALMTPGVGEGISSGKMVSVADSPMMRSESKSFKIGDKDYWYDPNVAAEQQGRSAATAEETANKQKYESLRKIPGIGDRGAARQVYGRAYDEQEETERARLQAEYVRNPSREAAAKVIEAKGTMQFPSDLFTKPHERELEHREPGPAYGTPEYMAAWEQMQGRREEATLEQIGARGEQSRMLQQSRPSAIKFYVDENNDQYYLEDPSDPLSAVYTGRKGSQGVMEQVMRANLPPMNMPRPEPGQRYKGNAPPLRAGTRPSPAYDRTYGDGSTPPTSERSSGRNAGAWKPLPDWARREIDRLQGSAKLDKIDEVRRLGYAYP